MNIKILVRKIIKCYNAIDRIKDLEEINRYHHNQIAELQIENASLREQIKRGNQYD